MIYRRASECYTVLTQKVHSSVPIKGSPTKQELIVTSVFTSFTSVQYSHKKKIYVNYKAHCLLGLLIYLNIKKIH